MTSLRLYPHISKIPSSAHSINSNIGFPYRPEQGLMINIISSRPLGILSLRIKLDGLPPQFHSVTGEKGRTSGYTLGHCLGTPL